MKKRPENVQPWMSADEYGKSLKGFVINLLVKNIDESLKFQRDVLNAQIVYSDPDFAVLRAYDAEWMLHADHTYQDHPMTGVVKDLEARGAGVELRLIGCDPDTAEARARENDYIVLQGAMDKPHGLREAFIADNEGYIWVPGVAVK